VPKVPKEESDDDDDDDDDEEEDDDEDDDEESDESDSEPEPKTTEKPTEKPTENAPAVKSPLLTGHRVSVTSDMDDVSLDSGEYIYSARNKGYVMCACWAVHACSAGAFCTPSLAPPTYASAYVNVCWSQDSS
jgi:hypothetical protein